jgi:hypothetical protein
MAFMASDLIMSQANNLITSQAKPSSYRGQFAPRPS